MENSVRLLAGVLQPMRTADRQSRTPHPAEATVEALASAVGVDSAAVANFLEALALRQRAELEIEKGIFFRCPGLTLPVFEKMMANNGGFIGCLV
ncbi:hypothetical protein LINPERHAP1_LOCUS39691 [Linum perenne]